jgi:hypothetical protein
MVAFGVEIDEFDRDDMGAVRSASVRAGEGRVLIQQHPLTCMAPTPGRDGPMRPCRTRTRTSLWHAMPPIQRATKSTITRSARGEIRGRGGHGK